VTAKTTKHVGLPVLCACLLLLGGCGSKQGGGKEPSRAGGGKKAKKGLSGGGLPGAVDDLNRIVSEADAEGMKAMIPEYVSDLLLEVVAFSPEDKGGGLSDPGVSDVLEFLKKNDVAFKYVEYDEEYGDDVIEITEGGEVVGAGTFSLVAEGEKTMVDFESAAQQWLEKVQSEGILRGKYIEVVENINEAVQEGDANAMKDLVIIDCLNLLLEERSYTVKYKKNLSLKLILDDWYKKGVVFEISDVDIHEDTAHLTVASENKTYYDGACHFATEIGKLKLDFSDLVEAKIAELEEEYQSQKKKRKKKKHK
jgi:hypothetical protein